jgi:hypothetical protein
MSTLISTAGWLGGLAIVTGYVLLLTSRIGPDARSFLMLNTVGGGLLTASAIYAGAWPNTVINLMWLLSGLYALIVKRSDRAEAATVEPAGGAHEDIPAAELVGTR